MKKLLSFVLCALIAALAFAACGGSDSEKPDENKAPDNAKNEADHIIYIRDEKSREDISATFKSTAGGDTYEVQAEKIDSGDGYTEFSCGADPSLYDRVVIKAGDESTAELAFNTHVSGWVLNSYRFFPYTCGKEIAEPVYERKSFEYENRTKDVLIRTPDDYDPASAEKYSVIYMTDGQNLFYTGATSTGSWAAAESIDSMAKNGGEKCIIVGIENADGWRDSELTPDIGEIRDDSFKDGHGDYFSDFVVNTVMPYINENYNVYTDREHTHICGSSSGGIESFYIAMEHPDKFASVGALSPAFVLYSDETWVEYLGEKDFSENAPFVYLYCGNSPSDSLEQTLYAGTVSMPDDLKKIGYPEDKVVTKLSGDALHNEMYWRAVFPDYLKYAFPKDSD